MDVNEAAWRKTFNEMPDDEASRELKEFIERFLIPDNISASKFNNNLDALTPSNPIAEFFGITGSDASSSPLIRNLEETLNCRLKFPPWFLAAYPDIIKWLRNVSPVEMNSIYQTLSHRTKKTSDLNESDLISGLGYLKSDFLGAVVEMFKKNNNNHSFECSRTEAEMASFEATQEAAELLHGGGDNFQIIARNVTKIYLELSEKHRERFESEASLLTAAGVLDALVYIKQGSIAVPKIAEMAQKAASLGRGALTEFIIMLEMRIFEVDNPDMSSQRIEEICVDQKPRIEAEIKRTKEQHGREAGFASLVSSFFDAAECKELRIGLGVLDE